MASQARRSARQACIVFVGVVAAAWCIPSPAAAAASAVGPGRVAVAPSTAAAGSTGNAFTFTYTTPTTQNVTGVLLVSAPQGFTTPQVRNPALPGFVTVVGGTCPAAVLGTAGQTIAIGLLCRSGSSFSFTYAGRGSKVTVPQEAKQYAFETSIFVISHPLVQLQLSPPIVSVVAVDRTPPALHLPGAITVEAGPAGAVVVYTATATDLVDGTDPAVCHPPSGSTFPLGTTTVSCSASDRAGNTATGTFPVTVTAATPPAITIAGVTDGQVSNAAALTPTFSATDDDLTTVAAILDGAPFVSGTPVAAEGAHLLVVTAGDRAGNRSTLTVHFTLDRTPPAISISHVTDGQLSSSPVTPSYTATDANLASLSANLDGSPFASGSAVAAEGAHLLVVTTADRAGNTATAAVHFTIDTTPPTLTITSPADGAHLAALSATISGNVHDASPIVLTVSGEPTALAADGSFDSTVALRRGANTIVVVATDAAGNAASVTRVVRANDAPPTLAIGAPADGLVTAASSVTVTGNVQAGDPTDPTPVSVTVNGEPTPVAADGSFSGSVPLVSGTNTIHIAASDAYGLQATANRTVVQDSTPPVITISGVIDGQVSNAPLTPSYSASDANLASLSATLDGAPFTSGATVSADGAHTLFVSASDLAGNTATASVHFIIDTSPPSLTVASPADGARIGGLTATVSGTVHDATSPVVLTIDGSPVPIAVDGSFSTAVSLVQGDNTIVVRATDAAGNSASISRTLRANTIPPALSIDAPADGLTTSAASVTVAGTALPGDSTDSVTVTVNGLAAAVAAVGSFSVIVPLAPGTNTIHVAATDGYGLQVSAERTVVRT